MIYIKRTTPWEQALNFQDFILNSLLQNVVSYGRRVNFVNSTFYNIQDYSDILSIYLSIYLSIHLSIAQWEEMAGGKEIEGFCV